MNVSSTDINECATGGVGWSSCTQVCDNTVGSYACSCQDGFILEADGTCTASECLLASVALFTNMV